MPTKLLSANRFRKIRYDGPLRDKVRVLVEASSPVNIYGVTTENLELFRKDLNYNSLFRFLEVTDIDKRISLPLDATDEWYLVIDNISSEPIAVHYQVFDV